MDNKGPHNNKINPTGDRLVFDFFEVVRQLVI